MQRTTAVRVLLLLGLACTFALLFGTARAAGAGRAAVFPEGTNTGIVVLDMSASISGPTYARVATTLKGIVNANQSIGLDMFSDTAYELLPPNSPPGALAQFIPFFVPDRYYGGTPVFLQTPWDTFMGGTRVGAGLAMARQSLRRAHVKHGAILLVSDLDDSDADQAAARAGIGDAPAGQDPGSDRAALRVPARPKAFRCALRRERVRRSERLHAHGDATCDTDRSASTVDPAPTGRAASAPARGQRTLERAARREGDGMKHLRRHRAALLSLLCAAAATILVVLAIDLRVWDTTVVRDDVRFRALPTHKALWRPATILPGDPAAKLIGTGSTLAYRQGLQYFWFSRTGSNPELRQDTPTVRANAQDRLRRLIESAPTATERSIAANLLGVLVVTTRTPGSDPAAIVQILSRGAQYFQKAITINPGNADAKQNLELVLRLQKPGKGTFGRDARAGYGFGRGRGAGIQGSGY